MIRYTISLLAALFLAACGVPGERYCPNPDNANRCIANGHDAAPSTDRSHRSSDDGEGQDGTAE